jgi:hypothetical protein
MSELHIDIRVETQAHCSDSPSDLQEPEQQLSSSPHFERHGRATVLLRPSDERVVISNKERLSRLRERFRWD